jgi:predicted MFS family arabinose efflux permease
MRGVAAREPHGLLMFTNDIALWVQRIIPNSPDEKGGEREKLHAILPRLGVAATTAVILTYIIGQTIIYIFVEPFLGSIGQVGKAAISS